jgi:chaperonin GroEL (HSP60 family)
MATDDGEVERLVIRDEEARTYVSGAADAIASLVRSTFGPRSLDTLIATVDPQGEPEVVLSNDGATILDAIERGEGFGHPVAALLIDSVDSMQRGIDDGTTTALLLTAYLLENAVDLIDDGVHPGTVALGYGVASGRAGRVFEDLSRPVRAGSGDLEAVARTSMTVDLPSTTLSRYSCLVADAVGRLAENSEGEWLDADDVKVVASTAAARDENHRGVVVRQWPRGLEAVEQEYGGIEEFDRELVLPDPVKDVRVALIDRDVDFEETATPLGESTYGGAAGVAVGSVGELDAYRSGLSHAIAEECDRLRALGVDLLVSQPGLDDDVRNAVRRAGIDVVDDVQTPLTDVHRIARLTDATVVSRLEALSEAHLGRVDRVQQRRVGEETWTTFERRSGPGSTLVLAAEFETDARLRERAVADAVNVATVATMDDQLLPGAGAAALAAERHLRQFATTLGGKHQLAVEAFADALERVVSDLARNAGLDPVAVVPTLRAAHAGADAPPAPVGIDVSTGDPVNAWEADVVEPRRVLSQAVETAQATAEQLLTTDAVHLAAAETDSHTPQTEHD